jgi:benzoylsuccinyl-CoA thiolase BbsA subunit
MSKIPIREGLFTDRVAGQLIGFKCKSCGNILPPLTVTCPVCYSNDLEIRPLSGKGKLYSYTVNCMDSRALKAPFPSGLIELNEGFRIYAILKGKPGKPFAINMAMEMVVDKLWDKDSDEIIGYKFQPV